MADLTFRGFSPDEWQRITDALNSRMETQGACPLCGVQAWAFNDGYVSHHVYGAHDSPNSLPPPRLLPTLAVTCGNCGNTLFLALGSLGLLDLLPGTPLSSAPGQS